MEALNSDSSRISQELRQEKLTCSDYKAQLDKQNEFTRDLKEKVDQIRKELVDCLDKRYALFVFICIKYRGR